MRLAFLFTDSMVFQRNKEIRVWGECETSAEVTGTFRGTTVRTVAQDGRFTFSFPPSEAGKGFTMSVSSGNQTITLKNIAVGEVFIAGGQSNMEMPLQTTKDGGYELQFLQGDDIRYLVVPRRHEKGKPCWGWHFIPLYSENQPWKIAGGENGTELSATAFYFAKRLQEVEQVPVGIIECDWGGTTIYNWISRADLLGNPDTAPYCEAHFKQLDEAKEEEYIPKQNYYNEELARRCPVTIPGEGFDFPPTSPNPINSQRFSGLYETMFQTICPFMVRGVIWYQGESDAGHPDAKDRYKKAFRLLIETWRRDLKNKDLIFITTLLAAFGNPWGDGPECESWAQIREAQIELAEEEAGVYYVNCMDNGETENIHPFEKRMLGERMAGCALAEGMGRDVFWKGPKLQSVKIENGILYIYFKHTGKYLMGDNVKITGFEIKRNGKWEQITVTSGGNFVHSVETDLHDAESVRFCYRNYSQVHLYNSLGLPAAPFGEIKIKK